MHAKLPESPPMSPPNGFMGANQYSRPMVPHFDPSHAPRKHNILYIMADQLAAPLLKMHNKDSQIKTPNLDALASQSVVFDSAYCNSPLCAPSRMAMVTGQLPSKIGAYDNACSISSDTPTYAHYLRNAGYETVLAGKMHFIGDQLHGYENRLTADIYPADYGWAVNWDEPGQRLEWYHNSSSILQAGPCVRSNQLDYDEEVMYKSKQFIYDHVRKGPKDARPFCLTVSLTHPHDPYTIEDKYWDMYDGVDIDLPRVSIPKDKQDAHSKRLLQVCELEGHHFTEDQIKRARRAYYGAVSYVDNCIGQLLHVLKQCRLDEDTIVIFSGDHGDMLGERGLWYKMSYFEASARVPLLVRHPKKFKPHRVAENVSTLDILPTLCDLANIRLEPTLPMDGVSFMPHLRGIKGHDTVFAEYMGEGTVAPMMMIRRGPWKYITCPADPPQLYNLANDPLELHNLAAPSSPTTSTSSSSSSCAAAAAAAVAADSEAQRALLSFHNEASRKWCMPAITASVLQSQRRRRLVSRALHRGRYESWDWHVKENSQDKYIRSHLALDHLELRARYPPVDAAGNERKGMVNAAGTLNAVPSGQAGAMGE